MKGKIMWFGWLCLYVLCVGLGTVTQRGATLEVVLTVLSLLFFVPGIWLLYRSVKTQNKKGLLALRIVSLSSLVLTLSLIVLNIVTVSASEAVGKVLNDLLIVVSAPMYCCYIRGISIFLWACLFVGTFPKIWQNKT